MTAYPIRTNPHPMRTDAPLIGQDAEFLRFLRLRRERAEKGRAVQ